MFMGSAYRSNMMGRKPDLEGRYEGLAPEVSGIAPARRSWIRLRLGVTRVVRWIHILDLERSPSVDLDNRFAFRPCEMVHATRHNREAPPHHLAPSRLIE